MKKWTQSKQRTGNSTSGYLPQRSAQICSSEDIYKIVHSSIIYSSLILSEVSHKQKDKYMIFLIWGINDTHISLIQMIKMNLFDEKNDTNELLCKTETDSQTQRTNYGHWREELDVNMYTLPCLKQITNRDLVYSTKNSAQYSNNLNEKRI